MTWRETLETALARGTAGQLAPAIRDALAFIDARDAAMPLATTLVEAGLFRTEGSGARVEIDARSTRRYDANGELAWEWMNTPIVRPELDEHDPVTEAEIRALGLDDGPIQ